MYQIQHYSQETETVSVVQLPGNLLRLLPVADEPLTLAPFNKTDTA